MPIGWVINGSLDVDNNPEQNGANENEKDPE
jgi:hypothetical protein